MNCKRGFYLGLKAFLLTGFDFERRGKFAEYKIAVYKLFPSRVKLKALSS